MLHGKISGTGSYLPEKILSNSDLEKIVDTSDEWIISRTGIKERHIAAENEKTSDLALIAAERALESAKMKPDDIDCIFVATVTPDMSFPSTACILQDKLQTQNGMAMDFNAACTGFIYGLHIANSLIATKQATNILLIGAEVLSSITDYTDRNTCVLLGDAAGAVIITPSNTTQGIHGTYVGADGSKGELLKRHGGLSRQPFHKMGPYDFHNQYMYMDGRAIFKSAVQRMTSSLSIALEKSGKTLDDLDMVIPHQANLRIIDSVREYAKLSEDQVYVNLPRTGNTSSATIPVAMDEAVKCGKLNKSDILGLTAFGGGLTFGAAIIEM
ncbi:MAG: ketoacyl-ACP synthase III [Spirochaetes bacterium]|nr:ketoacyl-ACP synthase III [Spirochaetota bacterium]